ncbi:hypothetical protein, partial [Streptomyces sp. NPDC002346]
MQQIAINEAASTTSRSVIAVLAGDALHGSGPVYPRILLLFSEDPTGPRSVDAFDDAEVALDAVGEGD